MDSLRITPAEAPDDGLDHDLIERADAARLAQHDEAVSGAERRDAVIDWARQSKSPEQIARLNAAFDDPTGTRSRDAMLDLATEYDAAAVARRLDSVVKAGGFATGEEFHEARRRLSRLHDWGQGSSPEAVDLMSRIAATDETISRTRP